MATIYYKGLTGDVSDVSASLAVSTIDDLIVSISIEEGLPSDWYKISLKDNPNVNEIAYGDSSTPLADMGFVDGSTVYCALHQYGTKELRQTQLLEIAQLKRRGGPTLDNTKHYYRTANTYDKSELPTQYSGDTLVNNANLGGLQAGRPWD